MVHVCLLFVLKTYNSFLTLVPSKKSGVDDSGADENVMGKDANDVSDVALTADGLWGVIAARNKIMITK